MPSIVLGALIGLVLVRNRGFSPKVKKDEDEDDGTDSGGVAAGGRKAAWKWLYMSDEGFFLKTFAPHRPTWLYPPLMQVRLASACGPV